MRCPLCDSINAQRLCEAIDRLHHLPGRFGFVACGGCGLVRLSPRPTPTALPAYYPDHYYSYRTQDRPPQTAFRSFAARLATPIRLATLSQLGYPVSDLPSWAGSLAPLLAKLFQKQALYGSDLRRFPRFADGGTVLEIGCGSGEHLNWLRSLGWRVAGAEFSPVAAQTAQSRFGIHVHVGDLLRAPFSPESFDVILMNHVLEHLLDPLATLSQANALLRKGGVLFIETPNVESIGRQICQVHWPHWDAPRHIHLFSVRTLSQLLLRTRFDINEVWTDRTCVRWLGHSPTHWRNMPAFQACRRRCPLL